jgi:hypothetical protein
LTTINEGARVRVSPREEWLPSLTYEGQTGLVTRTRPSDHGPLLFVHMDQGPSVIEIGFLEENLEKVQEEGEQA